MNKSMRDALSKSFAAPATQNKEIFLANIRYPKASYKEVFFSQISYLRKRVWTATSLLICVAALFIQWGASAQNDLAILSAVLPFISLIGILELHRTTAFRMAEMELACRYSLEVITLMRLVVLGVLGFVALLSFVVLAQGNDYGALRNLVYLAAPYLFCTAVSLCIVSKYREKEASYVCGAVCTMVSSVVLALDFVYPFIYGASYVFVWVGVCLALAVLLMVSVANFKHSQEELACS